MTTAVQRRRGTKTEHESFTGLEGEITVNTTNESLHVHDGSTTGGFETMRADGSNATSLNLNSTTNVDGVIDDDTLATASATKLATSESIKAYVDNQVGSVDTLSEILDNGNTSGASDIIISSGQSLTADTISETTVDAGVTIDSVLLKDGGATFTAAINSSSLLLSSGTPMVTLEESDGNTGYNRTTLEQAGNQHFQRTRNSSGTAVGTDYIATKGATGATEHRWRINNVDAMSVDSTGLNVVDDLIVNGNIYQNLSAGDLVLRSTAGTQDNLTLTSSGSIGVIRSDSGDLLFQSNGLNNKLRLVSGGADITGDLDVTGDLSATSATFSEAGTTALFLNRTSSYGNLIELQRDGTTRAAIGVPGNNLLSFNTGGTEAMRIDSDSDVGIGTTSPDTRLHVSDTSSELVRLERTGSTLGVGINFENNNGDFSMFGVPSGAGTGAFNPQGDANIDLGSSGSRFKDLFLSGGITLKGNDIGGEEITIADNAVGTITPPRNGGFAYVTARGTSSFPDSSRSILLFYDVGNSIAIVDVGLTGVGSNTATTTSNVTGTTGVDGEITYCVQSGVLKIENRGGGSWDFQVTFL